MKSHFWPSINFDFPTQKIPSHSPNTNFLSSPTALQTPRQQVKTLQPNAKMLFTNISTLLVVGSSVLLATAGVIAERKYAANEVAPLPGYALVEAVMSGTMLGQKFKLNGTAKVNNDNLPPYFLWQMLKSEQEVYTKLEKIHGTAKLAAAVSKIENTAAGPLARRDGSVSTELDKVWGLDILDMAVVC